jgi:tetratricopeptide (TPR) repeat protein
LFAKGVTNVLRGLPHVGLQRTWVNHAEDWAQRQLNATHEQLERLRNKELHRLLHLLASDPEAGLRHAIPLSGFAHRGIAPQGGRLGPRSLSFDPTRLGGGPADFWQVTPDLQNILRQRYREMADREMQLGRHRRAAYIYAELLGDLIAAANTLKQGGYFRDAALLYDEHLKNPLEAARCLAEGGLLLEAIERFEKLQRWLDVADLYDQLSRRQEAEAAVRRVVSERLSQDDILGAAKLVDERLNQPDEALELLLRAWPASRQAAGCVGAALQLVARLGRHETALKLVSQFRREPPVSKMVLPLLAIFGGPALDYPHEAVRHGAADLSRFLIARELNRSPLPAATATCLLQFLQQLAPEDRLLTRDANRHLAGRRSAELRVRRVIDVPARGEKPKIIHRFELPRQMEWLQLRRESHWFYAAGVTQNRLTLARGIWEGEFQSVSWNCSAQLAKNGLVLEPTGEQGAAVAVATIGGPPLSQRKMPAFDNFFGQECLAGTPAWLPPQGFSFTFGEESCWSGHVAAGRAVLTCHDKVGRLQQSIDITEELLAGAVRNAGTRFCLKSVGNGVAIALGNRLVLTRTDGAARLARVELPGQVIGLVATLSHTRQGVVALLEQGAALCWFGTELVIGLDRDLAALMGTFVPGGPLVLASGTELSLIEVDSTSVRKETRMELPYRAVGVVGTASPVQFAVLGAQGEVTVYRAAQ